MGGGGESEGGRRALAVTARICPSAWRRSANTCFIVRVGVFFFFFTERERAWQSQPAWPRNKRVSEKSRQIQRTSYARQRHHGETNTEGGREGLVEMREVERKNCRRDDDKALNIEDGVGLITPQNVTTDTETQV